VAIKLWHAVKWAA